jgi:hypothetical protein
MTKPTKELPLDWTEPVGDIVRGDLVGTVIWRKGGGGGGGGAR